MEGCGAGAIARRSESAPAGPATETGRTPRRGGTEAMSDREYPSRPFVGIGIVVIKDDHVLLCRRGKPPSVGSWTLPGGAQDLGETCEAAARRELMEETGLAVGDLHFCAH